MGGDAKILLVGDDPAQLRRWSACLEHAGWTAVICPGPRHTWGCPRLDGEPCARRELVDAAVVALPLDEWGEERLCTKVPDDGTTVFLDGTTVFLGKPAVSLRIREKGVEVSEETPGLLIDAVRDALGRRSATRRLTMEEDARPRRMAVAETHH